MVINLYLGNEGAVQIVESYMTQFGSKNSKKAVLLTGNPGLGKTHLTICVAEFTNSLLDIFNASAKRTKKDVKQIYLHTQMGDKRIVVLDECEGMKTADLKHLITKTTVPLFLCCNFIDEIDFEIKELCQVIVLTKPPAFVFKKYIRYLFELEGIPIDEKLISELANKAKSYRHAQRLVEDPEDDGSALLVSKYDQVELSLRGHRIEKYEMKPDELIFWINDNARDPDTISKANIMLERAFLGGYKYWKYAYKLLGYVRSNDKVEFPRTFKMMSKAKKNAAEGKSHEAKANVDIIFDSVNLDDIELESELTLDTEADLTNLTTQTLIDKPKITEVVQKEVDEWI